MGLQGFNRKFILPTPQFTFLDPPVQVNMKLDLVISPEMLANFEEIAAENDISFQVSTSDLQR